MRWRYKDVEKWHRWFAWRPVLVRFKDTDDGKVWVWWEHVERQLLPGYFAGYGYRLPPPCPSANKRGG